MISLVTTPTTYSSCGWYQQDGVPCSHAMASIFSTPGETLERHLPASMSISTWAAQYELALPPVDISGLRPAYNNPDDDADAISICNPPHTRVPRGRPRKKRQDKANFRATRGVRAEDMLEGGLDAPERRSVHCSTCREPGHYATTCRIPYN